MKSLERVCVSSGLVTGSIRCRDTIRLREGRSYRASHSYSTADPQVWRCLSPRM